MTHSPRARPLLVALAGAMMLAPGGPLQGQAPAGQTPAERSVRAVVDSFFTAIDREKWDSAVSFLDLAQFEPWFKQRVQGARVMLPPPPMTAERLMETDSTMPRAVADWQVDRMNAVRGDREFGDMSQEFAGITTLRAFFALTVPQAAARWLEAQDDRTRRREAYRRSGCVIANFPGFPAANHTVLGVALANDSLAYVIHTDDRYSRPTFEGFGAERVMRVHRVGGSWRIEPRYDLLNRPGMMISYGCPRKRD